MNYARSINQENLLLLNPNQLAFFVVPRLCLGTNIIQRLYLLFARAIDQAEPLDRVPRQSRGIS